MSKKIVSQFVGLMVVCSLTVCKNAAAQDTEIGAEQLRRYALLNEVIDLMKKDLSQEVNQMIKSQDGMTGQRYKELAATKGDKDKLEAIDSKEYEIKFLELVNALKTERSVAIKSVNQELATKMIGNRGKTYKVIKAELKSNSELKSQYDRIVASLKGLN